MKGLGLVALILVVVGAVNWGLVGLAQFQREELLAALLTFRALYFVLPLLLASLSLGLREFRMLARPIAVGRDRRAGDD